MSFAKWWPLYFMADELKDVNRVFKPIMFSITQYAHIGVVSDANRGSIASTWCLSNVAKQLSDNVSALFFSYT